jgi:transcriptional regulator with XRE-family HTH domain
MESQNTTEQAKVIGQRMARLRKGKGLTQQDLAARLNVAQSVISDYERGLLRLHGELILQLAEILGASPNEMLGVDGQARDNGPKNHRLYRRVQAIEQLPRRDQEALLRTIDAFLAKAN